MNTYRTQAWSSTHTEWKDVLADSMSHAAAITAARDAPKGGSVIVNVVDPDMLPHPNGAPRVIHRFELVVTPRPEETS